MTGGRGSNGDRIMSEEGRERGRGGGGGWKAPRDAQSKQGRGVHPYTIHDPYPHPHAAAPACAAASASASSASRHPPSRWATSGGAEGCDAPVGAAAAARRAWLEGGDGSQGGCVGVSELKQQQPAAECTGSVCRLVQ